MITACRNVALDAPTPASLTRFPPEANIENTAEPVTGAYVR